MYKHVLVTGARGLVGAEVIARLLSKGCSVVAFLHSDGPIVRKDGTPIAATAWTGSYPPAGQLAWVRGDVAEDCLGLERETCDRLKAGTECIIHCAALTTFGRKPELYEAINFLGTGRIIGFARRAAQGHIPLLYVSTAYVCGERPGIFRETDLELGQRLGNPYE